MNIELKIINTKAQRAQAKEIVEKYHSYVPTFNSVGRRIDWLIYIDNELCGMIGIGSSTYPPCKDILNYLDITKNEYKNIFNNFANNWRFCMCRNIPNAGTQILKQLRHIAPTEWKNKYGDELIYLLTFVGGGHNGAVYKADNWKHIGYTAGLPKHKSVSMKWDKKEQIAEKFVKPNGENTKMIFTAVACYFICFVASFNIPGECFFSMKNFSINLFNHISTRIIISISSIPLKMHVCQSILLENIKNLILVICHDII